MKKRPKEERIISSQEEYDALPKNYEGRIIIQGRERIKTKGSVNVEVGDYAIVVVYENSAVIAHQKSTVIAHDSAIVRAYGMSNVTAYESSNVRAYDSSTVTAYGSSTVTAYNSSTVRAYSYSQVIDCDDCDIILSGYARRVTLPANIQEYSDWYGIPIVDGKIKLYKAVRKHETGVYHSDYDPEFLYLVGKEYEQDCDTNRNERCARGLHVAYLDWAVNYCCKWKNAAILEVEVPIECIVVPRDTDGKIRTSKLKVLREVPRKEWR